MSDMRPNKKLLEFIFICDKKKISITFSCHITYRLKSRFFSSEARLVFLFSYIFPFITKKYISKQNVFLSLLFLFQRKISSKQSFNEARVEQRREGHSIESLKVETHHQNILTSPNHTKPFLM
jgi:hypothetical protein